MGTLLHSKDGVTQGDLLAIIPFGMRTPPLIQDLGTAHPGVTQPWYSDDAGMGSTFNDIHWHLDNPTERYTPREYFPDPTKRILVVSFVGMA